MTKDHYGCYLASTSAGYDGFVSEVSPGVNNAATLTFPVTNIIGASSGDQFLLECYASNSFSSVIQSTVTAILVNNVTH
jgi:hypothetical protein